MAGGREPAANRADWNSVLLPLSSEATRVSVGCCGWVPYKHSFLGELFG
jgi:hypothetical protein